MEKSTGKIWRAASGKSPFQRRNQRQARQELLDRTFRKSIFILMTHSEPGLPVDIRTYVRTYGRMDSPMTTKMFEIDGLPNFLKYGAPLFNKSNVV